MTSPASSDNFEAAMEFSEKSPVTLPDTSIVSISSTREIFQLTLAVTQEDYLNY